MTPKAVRESCTKQMSFDVRSTPPACAVNFLVLTRTRVVTTAVFETYWRFAAERQSIFFRRAKGESAPWTSDPILRRFRFTNAYRAADRVSQFLIREVQAQGPQDIESLFFRTILFKLFNRIDTWQLLEANLGAISPQNFTVEDYDSILTSAMGRGRRIYSAAYIMPSGGVEGSRKHQVHLRLLQTMMQEHLPARLAESRSMEEAFSLIRSYPTIGDFLAYQYVTDLNYSGLLSFDEMDFVTPGPGARSGIQKCFGDRGSYSDSDLIRWMAEHQDEEFRKRGIEFATLWGRPLQLIDCQNLFCEVDKYSRVFHPEIQGLSGRTRIKQEYRCNPSGIEYWLPPKWELNERIAAWSRAHSAKIGMATPMTLAAEKA